MSNHNFRSYIPLLLLVTTGILLFLTNSLETSDAYLSLEKQLLDAATEQQSRNEKEKEMPLLSNSERDIPDNQNSTEQWRD